MLRNEELRNLSTSQIMYSGNVEQDSITFVVRGLPEGNGAAWT